MLTASHSGAGFELALHIRTLMAADRSALPVHGKVGAIAPNLAVLCKINQELRTLRQMLQGFT